MRLYRICPVKENAVSLEICPPVNDDVAYIVVGYWFRSAGSDDDSSQVRLKLLRYRTLFHRLCNIGFIVVGGASRQAGYIGRKSRATDRSAGGQSVTSARVP